MMLVLQVSWIPSKSNRVEAPQSFVIHGATFSPEKALVLSTLMLAPNTERRFMVVGWNITVTVKHGIYFKRSKVLSPICAMRVIDKPNARQELLPFVAKCGMFPHLVFELVLISLTGEDRKIE
jgi:hypothetical protein